MLSNRASWQPDLTKNSAHAKIRVATSVFKRSWENKATVLATDQIQDGGFCFLQNKIAKLSKKITCLTTRTRMNYSATPPRIYKEKKIFNDIIRLCKYQLLNPKNGKNFKKI